MPNDTDLFASAFFLADHAAVESGKLYTSGGFWNMLNFPSFPAVMTFSVAAVLNVPWRAHHQTHKFVVSFEDADGKKLAAGFQGDFQVGSAPPARVGDPTIMPIAAVMGNFVFPTSGDFSAVLEVDGTELSRWPFRASQVAMPMMPQGPISPANIPPMS